MDRLDRMQLFVRIVERRSFSAAAADLGLARSTVTEAVKQLEEGIGTRLLERTTRYVTPTLDGRAFYERCLAILADVDEAENIFRDAQPRGLLRVDAHGFLTRTFLLPRLHEFLDRYPLLELQIGQGDRLVDLVREGVDCVIRAGEIDDSGLIMRRLGTITEITCASRTYVEKYGLPKSPDALEGHLAIGFLSSRTGQIMPLEFAVGNEVRYVTLPSRLTVNNSDTMVDLARRGFGLIQAPRYRLQRDIDEGVLVEVLADFPPPPTLLSALYPQNRQLSPRVRVFLDWIVKVFAEAGL
ncbi:LysR family transcriptional regulator [Neorhizobium galegae]|uniref:LysR family transcriptional regulator n=1 Tax=Neorhizobium galegae TaxID=399 RepID=UPI00062137ED|nr:LysR family transcriptional regulator [Neorhizobium galegae]MCQ1766337.1 LysR family transcriptional regulator [Neorhizobium galegae]MCQ1845251.1 LysR family transcriptional regulator [Neorhizobium galegae]CDZ36550.1 Transcriptional regulator, LysR family [Neorhizobium galegae bv. officinalis]